jgi:hypothetical protein
VLSIIYLGKTPPQQATKVKLVTLQEAPNTKHQTPNTKLPNSLAGEATTVRLAIASSSPNPRTLNPKLSTYQVKLGFAWTPRFERPPDQVYANESSPSGGEGVAAGRGGHDDHDHDDDDVSVASRGYSGGYEEQGHGGDWWQGGCRLESSF